nr:Retrovirus-related Pol polyprotein from transposon TNT 1-94 [Ipomoea batatas]
MVGFDLASSNATSSTTISEGDAQPTVVSLSENSSSEPAGKLGYLNGEVEQLASNDPTYKWDLEDSMMQQGEHDLTYYNEMMVVWQELDLFEEEEWESLCDSAQYRKMIERSWVFSFLAGHGIPEKPVAAGWKKKSSSDNKLGGDVCAFQVSNSDPGQ